MFKAFIKKFFIILLGLSFGSLAQAYENFPIKLYVASSLKPLIKEATELYTNTLLSDLKPRFIINAQGSQILKLQILYGARADIFLSADLSYVKELAKSKKIAESDYGALCGNRLVLILSDLSEYRVNDILEITNLDLKFILGTKGSPFGEYTKKVIDNIDAENKGFANKINSNAILYEPSVSRVLPKIKLGLADIAFVYMSDTINQMSGIRVYEVPTKFQTKIIYGYGIIKQSNFKKESMDFISFLKSNSAKNLFAKYGFKNL